MEAMMALETRFSAGIEYFERPGSGRTLVLLHGIGSNGLSFAPLIPELPADWRVIAWNAPGYGNSVPLPMEWPVARDYAEVFGSFVDRLDLRDMLLVGHSLGALMATSFCIARPDHVRHLVLTAPASGHGVTPGSEMSAAASGRIHDLETLGSAAFARARAPRLVFDPQGHPQFVEQVQAVMARISLPGYAQAARMLSSGRLLEDVVRLSVTTDVVVGEGDLVTPPEKVRLVYQALPALARGQLIEVPQTGHALYLQTAAAFADLLMEATR